MAHYGRRGRLCTLEWYDVTLVLLSVAAVALLAMAVSSPALATARSGAEGNETYRAIGLFEYCSFTPAHSFEHERGSRWYSESTNNMRNAAIALLALALVLLLVAVLVTMAWVAGAPSFATTGCIRISACFSISSGTALAVVMALLGALQNRYDRLLDEENTRAETTHDENNPRMVLHLASGYAFVVCAICFCFIAAAAELRASMMQPLGQSGAPLGAIMSLVSSIAALVLVALSVTSEDLARVSRDTFLGTISVGPFYWSFCIPYDHYYELFEHPHLDRNRNNQRQAAAAFAVAAVLLAMGSLALTLTLVARWLPNTVVGRRAGMLSGASVVCQAIALGLGLHMFHALRGELQAEDVSLRLSAGAGLFISAAIVQLVVVALAVGSAYQDSRPEALYTSIGQYEIQ